MNWQLPIVLLIVSVAAIYLCRSTWLSLVGRKSGCGGGCSCSASQPTRQDANGQAPLIPANQLTLRRQNPPQFERDH
jgi:hypothetical protein